jgi:16S rRNA (guanine1207-N2)-methyltransferase
MDNALSTLFYPFEQGLIALPVGAVAFLNARLHPLLKQWEVKSLHLHQYFKPYARQLQDSGFTAEPFAPASIETCNLTLVLVPKNATEGAAIIAQALLALEPGGLLVCAADNKSGGPRLEKILTGFGLINIRSESKNKARVVWAKAENLDKPAIQQALAAGMPQKILDGQFISIPGIFGWDKIDAGSALLIKHLPHDLTGHGADFGCGYGILARHVLDHNPSVESLACIDADARTVQVCRQNLENHNARAQFFWEDLTVQNHNFENLDFIVMNPPFHEGRGTDIGIGLDFIATAARSLKVGGTLWMVANAQLPYEEALKSLFKSCSREFEGAGFKIFKAQK